MKLQENYSLKHLNTFGINAYAKRFGEFSSLIEIQNALDENLKSENKLILGGGSNILFTKDFDGIVLKNNLKGIEIVKEDLEFYFVKAAAGENWHKFVMHCVENNYAGIENLSLIPGNVGAGPMQNIGAYGVELKDVFYELEALNIAENKIHVFANADCEFGYRESIFKGKAKNQYIIISVTFKLRKAPAFNTSYGAIDKELEAMGVSELSLKAISKAVCNIRSSKLPDPAVIGNAGSFFKNPTINIDSHTQLKEKFPDLVSYAVYSSDKKLTGFKLAAGWLIEQCGWKGKTIGEAGVHKNQALVLVNYGNAHGSEILELSKQIIDSVKEKFGVSLEREVNII